jgi:acyl-CoA dehydrogenase
VAVTESNRHATTAPHGSPVPAFSFEEQEIFRRDARRFVETEVTPQVDDWERQERIPRAFWLRLGELGYLGLAYPELYGGSGSTFTAQRIFLEELSRCGSLGVTLSVGVHTDMSANYILEFGSDAQRDRYLPSIIKGERICGIAITEPAAGSDVAGIRAEAQRRGSHFVLNGTKTFISNGIYGDLFVVAARTRAGSADRRHDGISLFIAERGIPGFSSSRKLEKMGFWASDTAELHFQECQIPDVNLLGEEGAGFVQLMKNLQRERLVIALVSCASAGRMLEEAVEYARQRRAFGEPLSHFQAIRHRIVDAASSLEAASTFVRHLAGRFESGIASDSDVSIGKLIATEAANQVADVAVQVFGGNGCMREFLSERYYRDARCLKVVGGSSEILKELIAKRMNLI